MRLKSLPILLLSLIGCSSNQETVKPDFISTPYEKPAFEELNYTSHGSGGFSVCSELDFACWYYDIKTSGTEGRLVLNDGVPKHKIEIVDRGPDGSVDIIKDGHLRFRSDGPLERFLEADGKLAWYSDALKVQHYFGLWSAEADPLNYY